MVVCVVLWLILGLRVVLGFESWMSGSSACLCDRKPVFKSSFMKQTEQGDD